MSTLTVCYAAKGGSGTTVTAAALALANPNDTVLVDLDGELPAVLGLPDPTGDGITDWANTDLAAASLDLLLVDVNSTTRLLPHGHDPGCGDRWEQLTSWLCHRPGATIVDAGTGDPPRHLVARADQVLLVTRPCYLSLRRATASSVRPDGIVLIHEPGRALIARDVEGALGTPVVTTLALDPAVARAVDAGLLTARLPRSLHSPMAAIRGKVDLDTNASAAASAVSAPVRPGPHSGLGGIA